MRRVDVVGVDFGGVLFMLHTWRKMEVTEIGRRNTLCSIIVVGVIISDLFFLGGRRQVDVQCQSGSLKFP